MNPEQLRQTIKTKWLAYYENNRHWITRLAVWVNYQGKRRPSAGFILGTLSVLEPQLTYVLPVIVDLSNDPDRLILALGLNFNPDEELAKLDHQALERQEVRYLPPKSFVSNRAEEHRETAAAKKERATPPNA
ncbi:DUF5331 domain-containing protein [Thermosynechococcaceae cyanobacterium BACA0444]|uniref:DUF5331 domain-containing protein n=1 Tax=Pseudocalidococcus azoricus BACA0444 TaxID=2918990 RepID=A0AAE4FS80_9CYAN|nr:DUF5331 domain-containing protein [Pseudocalidococcus azoricus]MDS3860602.1 DUF5331 domain-containing protein [Pseudocalidococcus azoricus BACA0444]